MSVPINGDCIPILLPQAGNSMEEGTILAWRVQPGDRVVAGQVLFELETDKATLEVEAEQAGRIAAIVVAAGQSAPVKTPVAYFGEGESVAPTGPSEMPVAMTPVPAAPHVAAARAPDPSRNPLTPTRKRVSPAARRVAQQHAIDCDQLPAGSGPEGRILVADVRRALEIGVPAAKPSGPKRVPIGKMRRAIARNLTLSKQTLPHWYTKLSVDADPLMHFYRQEKAQYPCTVNDVIVLAVSRVVREMPMFRTQIDGDDLVEHEGAHLGMAVGLEEGLVVPVLRSAESRNLREIAAETRRLADNARVGKVEAMGEGVFTISNLGMYGVEEFAAIINPPEAAILAVGAVREEVIVREGALRIGKKLTLVLSADHRLIDGTLAARFMTRLKALLEDPTAIEGR